ncbi:hypothetical protein MBLNU459_g1584t1 [Dothideomycetes sp. NU459]
MSNQSPILEGVFAINKPTGISSAQVLRDLQEHLNPSKLFAPWISAERDRRQSETANQQQKRSRRQRGAVQVKIGHGGTLDPLATGVLIVGLGAGTKSLQGFLDCKKKYEAVLLFGAATDSYDSEGRIVKRAPYSHVTRAGVEDKLGQYRGDIMQKPPVYSALRVQGKRLYEYAREGKEIPVEIQARPVHVSALECVDWLEPGTHKYHWPEAEAEQEEKDVVGKVLHLDEVVAKSEETQTKADAAVEAEDSKDLKRKRDEDVNGAITTTDTSSSPKRAKQDGEAEMSGAIPDGAAVIEPAQRKPCPAPAAQIRMTVSSGFYVRSLCHDLGAAVGSLGLMVSLERSTQGEFELGRNVLEYDDLAKGEEVWGPQITDLLAQWNTNHPPGSSGTKSRPAKRQMSPEAQAAQPKPRRRNSSSPEP